VGLVGATQPPASEPPDELPLLDDELLLPDELPPPDAPLLPDEFPFPEEPAFPDDPLPLPDDPPLPDEVLPPDELPPPDVPLLLPDEFPPLPGLADEQAPPALNAAPTKPTRESVARLALLLDPPKNAM
jgi:protein TonB